MARRRKTFWTPEKLKELEKIYPKLTRIQLTKKYKKPIEAITAAYEFVRLQKRMKISFKKTKYERVTIYKPGFAEGAISSFNEFRMRV